MIKSIRKRMSRRKNHGAVDNAEAHPSHPDSAPDKMETDTPTGKGNSETTVVTVDFVDSGGAVVVDADDSNYEVFEESSVSSDEKEEQRQRKLVALSSCTNPSKFVQNDLEALRVRQFARNLREDEQKRSPTQTVSSSVPIATSATEAFYLNQRAQNKQWKEKQKDSKIFLATYRGAVTTAKADESTTKSPLVMMVGSHAGSGPMEQFFNQQRAMNQEWKQRQRDANDYLHRYRGYVLDKQENLTFEDLLILQRQAAAVPLPMSPPQTKNVCPDTYLLGEIPHLSLGMNSGDCEAMEVDVNDREDKASENQSRVDFVEENEESQGRNESQILVAEDAFNDDSVNNMHEEGPKESMIAENNKENQGTEKSNLIHDGPFDSVKNESMAEDDNTETMLLGAVGPDPSVVMVGRVERTTSKAGEGDKKADCEGILDLDTAADHEAKVNKMAEDDKSHLLVLEFTETPLGDNDEANNQASRADEIHCISAKMAHFDNDEAKGQKLILDSTVEIQCSMTEAYLDGAEMTESLTGDNKEAYARESSVEIKSGMNGNETNLVATEMTEAASGDKEETKAQESGLDSAIEVSSEFNEDHLALEEKDENQEDDMERTKTDELVLDVAVGSKDTVPGDLVDQDRIELKEDNIEDCLDAASARKTELHEESLCGISEKVVDGEIEQIGALQRTFNLEGVAGSYDDVCVVNEESRIEDFDGTCGALKLNLTEGLDVVHSIEGGANDVDEILEDLLGDDAESKSDEIALHSVSNAQTASPTLKIESRIPGKEQTSPIHEACKEALGLVPHAPATSGLNLAQGENAGQSKMQSSSIKSKKTKISVRTSGQKPVTPRSSKHAANAARVSEVSINSPTPPRGSVPTVFRKDMNSRSRLVTPRVIRTTGSRASSPCRSVASVPSSRIALRDRHFSPRFSDPLNGHSGTCQFLLDLHSNVEGCDNCLAHLTPDEKLQYEKDGHHYRVNRVRGGCSRSCPVFPKKDNEPPARLCRQCFHGTHYQRTPTKGF